MLQDGSASMRVKDVAGDRWQRSIRFLRMLGDSMSWKEDRIALAVFARIAAPQIRLTKDPNTFFFFLDHLDKAPPFRLEDAIDLGYQPRAGHLLGAAAHRARRGDSRQELERARCSCWSPTASRGAARSRSRCKRRSSAASRSSSSASARWRAARCRSSRTKRARSSSIPRRRRRRISIAPVCRGLPLSGAGQYFELDRDGDRHIANPIIDAGKKMAPSLGAIQESEELYWRFLAIASAFPFIGALFLRDRPELWLQVIGVAAALTVVSIILG